MFFFLHINNSGAGTIQDAPGYKGALNEYDYISNSILHQTDYSGQKEDNPEIGGSGQRTAGQVWTDFKNVFRYYIEDSYDIYTAPIRFEQRDWLIAGASAALTGILIAFDEQITDELIRAKDADITGPVIGFADEIESVGHMGKTNRYYFAGLFIGYAFDIKPLTTISAQILETHLIAGGIKNAAILAVGRRRPHEDEGAYNFWDGGTSFPSGHALNVFQVATILSHHSRMPSLSVFYYGLAGIIGVQRVSSESHWPSDVFIAGVLGYTAAKAVIKLHENRKTAITPMVKPESNAMGFRILHTF